ncbi:YheC/YheD family protein [Peribacillus cavernae]|uniref:YheC/YheD family protein n=1 Tax=Peribacillus cavernae TaxID=1674310 RepID=A0A433HNN1_9BACI|nr:YheC/YheD family protein [Peribacillus cavernae]MDQ0217630.1 glutathione synthase/RimK-type ligase-like ATP-grasp enzyme [Peribacillus cavernae]RUQ29941.1 YheC/YheD family protein [Peribacillus cavernae]
MLSLGIMSSQLRSEEMYFTEVALASEKENLFVYRFCPAKIDTGAETIHGEKYDYPTKEWIASQFSIPDFIYDRSFHGLIRQSEKVRFKIEWLKNHSAFLGFGLPGKHTVFQSLAQMDRLSRFLPPVKRMNKTGDIWRELSSHKKIILKPEFGSRGIGIYLLCMEADGWLVRMTKRENGYERFFDKKAALERWFLQLLQECPYVSQPYIELSNSEDEPYDVRIMLQKDSKNNWIERGRGVRVGRKHCITANLAAGARAVRFESLLQTFPPLLQPKIEMEIQDIIHQLPIELEDKFNRLFEIGLDLGIDKKGGVWILDINSKPGRKVIELLHPDKMHQLYKAPALYCRCLAGELLESR